MDAAWLTIIATAIGALAALAGSALGPLVSSRRDHAAWVRDKRAETFEQFFGALDRAKRDAMMENILAGEYGRHGPTPVPRASREELRDRSERLSSAAQNMQLYASGRLRVMAQIASVRYTLLIGDMINGMDEQSRQVYDEFIEVTKSVDKLLRKDLGVEDGRKFKPQFRRRRRPQP